MREYSRISAAASTAAFDCRCSSYISLRCCRHTIAGRVRHILLIIVEIYKVEYMAFHE